MGWHSRAPAPEAPSRLLLLTDGSIFAQIGLNADWARLWPDANGEYDLATWSLRATPSDPGGFNYSVPAAVLGDGRVIAASGGADIYDPVRDHWDFVPLPPQFGEFVVATGPSCMLADGRFLVTLWDGMTGQTNRTAAFDPTTRTWQRMADMLFVSDVNSSFTLLPDDSVVSFNIGDENVGSETPVRAQRYVPSLDRWIDAGMTTFAVGDVDRSEVWPEDGPPTLLLPDGRVLIVARSSLVWHPPVTPDAAGTFEPLGIDFPATDTTGRALLTTWWVPACVLPNGNVLCGALYGFDSHAAVQFFELDVRARRFDAQPNPRLTHSLPRMLLLPDGKVLVTQPDPDSGGPPVAEIYESSGTPRDEWRPTITMAPAHVSRSMSYPLVGTQLNGLTQAQSNPGDVCNATNYPLVQFVSETQPSHVTYFRTQTTRLPVATGAASVQTTFTVGPSVPHGPGRMRVIANGIPSAWVDVIVDAPMQFPHPDDRMILRIIGNLADGRAYYLGRDGRLHPIPPFPPYARLIKESQAALAQLRDAAAKLQTIGQELQRKK